MAKSANLYARIEPDVIEQAERILNALDIPASNEAKLPEHPLNVSQMTAAQLDAELEKGYADHQAGRAVPAKQAFSEIRKEYGV